MANKSPGSVPRVVQVDGDITFSEVTPVMPAEVGQPQKGSHNKILGVMPSGKAKSHPNDDLEVAIEDSDKDLELATEASDKVLELTVEASDKDVLDGEALRVPRPLSIPEECLQQQREQLTEMLARTALNTESCTGTAGTVPVEHLLSVMSENRLLRQQLGSLLTLSGSSISEYLDLVKAREEAAQLRQLLNESNIIHQREVYEQGQYINHLTSLVQQQQSQVNEMEEEINRVKNENNGLKTKLSDNSAELSVLKNFIKNLSVSSSDSASSPPISQTCAISSKLETVHQHIIEADNTEGQSLDIQTQTDVIMDVAVATSTISTEASVEQARTLDVQCVDRSKDTILVPAREGEEELD